MRATKPLMTVTVSADADPVIKRLRQHRKRLRPGGPLGSAYLFVAVGEQPRIQPSVSWIARSSFDPISVSIESRADWLPQHRPWPFARLSVTAPADVRFWG